VGHGVAHALALGSLDEDTELPFGDVFLAHLTFGLAGGLLL
jgi:hypothetical protein